MGNRLSQNQHMIYQFMTVHTTTVLQSSQSIMQQLLKCKRLEHSRENLINFQLPKGTALVEDGQELLHSCCHHQTFKEHISLCKLQTWLVGHVRHPVRAALLFSQQNKGGWQGEEGNSRVRLIHRCVLNGIFSL